MGQWPLAAKGANTGGLLFSSLLFSAACWYCTPTNSQSNQQLSTACFSILDRPDYSNSLWAPYLLLSAAMDPCPLHYLPTPVLHIWGNTPTRSFMVQRQNCSWKTLISLCSIIDVRMIKLINFDNLVLE